MDMNRADGLGSKVVIVDDFHQAAVSAESWADQWLSFDGAGTSAVSATVVLSPEGTITLVNGTAGTAGIADAACMSALSLAGDGALVSLGGIVLRARVSADLLTGATINVGLSDKICSDSAEAVLHVIKAAAIADDGLTVSNCATFVQDSEATSTTEWYASSENATVIANVATADDAVTSRTLVADTYDDLRIEIDAEGNIRFYINDVFEYEQLLGVATDAVLVPYLAITAEDGTPVSTTLNIDSVEFEHNRNSSNA